MEKQERLDCWIIPSRSLQCYEYSPIPFPFHALQEDTAKLKVKVQSSL